VLANNGVNIESGNRAVGVGDHGDHFGPRGDVVKRLDYQSSFVAHSQRV
jgi:hypothetical protein